MNHLPQGNAKTWTFTRPLAEMRDLGLTVAAQCRPQYIDLYHIIILYYVICSYYNIYIYIYLFISLSIYICQFQFSPSFRWHFHHFPTIGKVFTRCCLPWVVDLGCEILHAAPSNPATGSALWKAHMENSWWVARWIYLLVYLPHDCMDTRMPPHFGANGEAQMAYGSK